MSDTFATLEALRKGLLATIAPGKKIPPHPANAFRTERAPLAQVMRWDGEC